MKRLAHGWRVSSRSDESAEPVEVEGVLFVGKILGPAERPPHLRIELRLGARDPARDAVQCRQRAFEQSR
jgi:hypothetical protein